jgi:CheY-like chemotaxis protein
MSGRISRKTIMGGLWTRGWVAAAVIGGATGGYAYQEPAGGTATLPAISDTTPAATRLILETLRAGNPQTANDLCKALQIALDVEEFAEARYYFQRLQSLNLDPPALLRLNQEIGSDFFLRLHAVPELAPEAPTWVDQMFAAARSASVQPERLAGLIERLNDERNEVRAQAFRDLEKTGPDGAAALLNVFADRERQAEFVNLRQALRALGESALGPLVAAAGADSLQVRYEALTALARVSRTDAYDAAVAGYFAPDSPEALREALAYAFEITYGRVPPREESLAKIRHNAQEFLGGRKRPGEEVRLDRDYPYVNVWRWDADSKSLKSAAVTSETASRMLAMDRARDLFRIDSQNPDYRLFYLVSYLDAQKRWVGPIDLLTPENLRAEFPGVAADEVDAAITEALKQNLLAAAAGGCDLLVALADGNWLCNRSGTDSGIIRAIQSGNRHVQFTALRTIATWDPQKAFPGSSYVLSSAIYLAGYGERPSALIAHPQTEFGQNLSVALSTAGVDGRTVQLGRDFFQQATSDSNIQMLWIADSVHSPDFVEIVQQLRADWRTKRTPIAILTASEQPQRARRVALRDPYTVVLPYTNDTKLVKLQVERLQGLIEPWPLSNQEGQLFAGFSGDWLERITADRQRYGYFDLAAHFDSLSDLILNPLHTRRALVILGHIATPPAQRRLVDYASQNAAPIELRQTAVAAFRTAVEHRGVLLTTAEIQQQYARYQASLSQSGESQRTLGAILDLLEKRVATGGTRE